AVHLGRDQPSTFTETVDASVAARCAALRAAPRAERMTVVAASRRVLVAGGGIGGLATAIALKQVGIDVTVFERAPDLRALEVGLGIHLWQNAIRALRKLGVDTIETVGERMERMEWRNARGRFIAAWNVGDLGREL